jgi:hypothetical protein
MTRRAAMDRSNEYFGSTPVTKRLLDLIQENADELTKCWMQSVRKDPGTPTYAKYEDEKELYQRAFRVFHHLGIWLSDDSHKDEIKHYWTNLGRQRRNEGFAMSEIVQSLHLIRRHLWEMVETEGLLDTAYDLYQAMELHNRVTLFFDRAVFHAARGYESKD